MWALQLYAGHFGKFKTEPALNKSSYDLLQRSYATRVPFFAIGQDYNLGSIKLIFWQVLQLYRRRRRYHDRQARLDKNSWKDSRPDENADKKGKQKADDDGEQ